MSKIKSITLSNIRRFGPEATIQFSPGVTVLLAPNGTGKTSVFEAIEFGLTGKIARLEDNLSPIIRDSAEQARVCVNFDDAERTVSIDRSGDVTIEGDLDSVFGDTDPSDIPFLLRLTHLLDQRERDWFVQADAKVAGSHLAKLPIGRNGSQANTVLAGARRHITELLKQLQSQVHTNQVEQEEWIGLLRDRDASTAHLEHPLKPQEQIFEALEDIAEATQCVEHLPLAQAKVESLDTAQQVLLEIIEARTQRLDTRLSELTAFSGMLGTFESERERIILQEQEHAQSQTALELRKQEHARSQFEFSQLQANLRLAEQRRSVLAQQVALFVEASRAREELARRKQEFGVASDRLVWAERDAFALRDQLQSVDQLALFHENLRSKLQGINQSEGELTTAGKLIERWGSLLGEIEGTESAIEYARDQVSLLGVQYQDAIGVHAQKERAEGDARNRQQTLTHAVDSMRQAVSMIAANLPADWPDCPVCGVEHGAEELHSRVQKSLKGIDPALALAERELKAAGDELRSAEAAVSTARASLQAARSNVSDLEEQLATFLLEVDDIRANRHASADSPELAREALLRRLIEIDTEKQRLTAEQTALVAQVSPEMTVEIRHNAAQAFAALHAARQAKGEATAQLDLATGSFAALEAEAASSAPVNDLSIEQARNEQQVATLKAKAQSDSEALARQQSELLELDTRNLDRERQLAEGRSRLAALRGKWKQFTDQGDPSVEIASSLELQLRSELSTLARHSASLEKLGLEISGWKRSEHNRMAQTILDRRRGNLSTEEVTQRLQEKIDDLSASVARLSQLSGALESLSRFLSTEIDNIHDHVVAVVPRWQALLKRIVRDQRFSETNLDFYSRYNKEHASVLVPLHGDTVPVLSVASEAQMTDLQLTFLLSMAVNHRWSPWRALLLDDPTQHHDLVHAASVFDVLRDYIVDHGFQVVIATHDALQARFFMRKLKNDGIDAQMWSLVPTANGVTAVPA
ncbi:AAA family ATPase [Pseudomonas fragi]|uniref:AAA family ATPase n=1 Tax=Pseudomonas fragi TaxID=296 RepID=UPI00147284C7|nr:SMC family ATPase [Pseudomonas fragi]NNB17742.1 SMC family ATPase [Pseudomonas fragi]NNB19634.1 SMC family ATPase [Pseudomonas fragi]